MRSRSEWLVGFLSNHSVGAMTWPQGFRGTFLFTGSIALLDQLLVSGTNFLTALLVGRLCGPEELGFYSLGFSIAIVVLGLQESLIVSPYIHFRGRFEGRSLTDYSGAALLSSALLSLPVVLGLLLGGTVWHLSRASQMGVLLWVMAAAVPFLVLREFGRRFHFSNLQSKRSLRLDAVTVGLQLGFLGALVALDWFSALNALLSAGLACAVTGLAWLFRRRNQFGLNRQGWVPAARRNWNFGKWIWAAQMIYYLKSEILILWLLAFILGEAATGVFAACLAVVYLSNPFVLGIGQILSPWIKQALDREGQAGMRQLIHRTAAGLAVPMAGFCLLLMLFGQDMLAIFYGEAFGRRQGVIVVLGLSVLTAVLGMAPRAGLSALGRPDLRFKTDLTGSVLGVSCSAWLISSWELLGVACGLWVGHLVATGLQWLRLFELTREGTDSVLQQTGAKQEFIPKT